MSAKEAQARIKINKRLAAQPRFEALQTLFDEFLSLYPAETVE